MENNKLLAEFLGLKVYKGKNDYTGEEYYYYNNEEMQAFEAIPDYESDWNYLMIIVEKIDLLKDKKDLINWSRNNWTIFDFKLSESKILNVYKACLEFVKWYNKNSEIK